MADVYALVTANDTAAQYRNNIVHGVCYGKLYISGEKTELANWFLFPPHHNTRRRKGGGIDDKSADYIYNAADIEHCELRFKQLTEEAAALYDYLSKVYPLS
jgi:hypothetical protein